MKKKAIFSKNSPAPGGNYSQAIEIGNFIFASGQLPIHMKTGEIEKFDPVKSCKLCFENLSALCKDAGSHMNNIVKLNVFMTNEDVSKALDQVLPEYFTEPYPARSRIYVNQISKSCLIEIEAVMVKNNE